MDEGVSIIILTYNGAETFSRCLNGIKSQEFSGSIDLIVVDSGSTDGSVEVAKSAGANVTCIENKDFHHSRTRNSALHLAQFEKIVYLVQDAVPVSTKWLSQLCSALDEDNVVSASGRQIPHDDADTTARFEVEFHGEYLGDKPYLKYVESLDKFADLSYDDALHTIRHDNVCSIYRRNLLKRYPFPDVDFAEDMAWAHAMLLRGYKILYDPRIIVRHSHNRPPEYRFNRAIANSIACAKILGRIKEDISYLSVADVVRLHDNLNNYAKDLKKQWAGKPAVSSHKIDIAHYYLLARKYVPFLKKVLQFLQKSRSRSEKNSHLLHLQQASSNHISFVMSMITGRYTVSSIEDYAYCVDQVTATTVGTLYGELYGGNTLKGTLSRDVEELILPYLQGV